MPAPCNQAIPFPEGKDAYGQARQRLAFEELFLLSLSLLLLKGRDKGKTAVQIKNPDMKLFYHSLPFELTGAQKRAIGEILSDMAGEAPMNRLLQGDVGSGQRQDPGGGGGRVRGRAKWLPKRSDGAHGDFGRPA